MPVRYSNSRIMRRCGELGVPYTEAIASRHLTKHGRQPLAHRVQYADGRDGTAGRGAAKMPNKARPTTPHSLKGLYALLASSPWPATTLRATVTSGIQHGVCAGASTKTKPTHLHLDSPIVVSASGIGYTQEASGTLRVASDV